MALSIEDKKKIVSDVNELANNASSLVLADARGLKVAEANELDQKDINLMLNLGLLKIH